MVAELAYRCVILNGFLDDKAVIESRGIVMIDELDLHLHPTWQRHVIADLKMHFLIFSLLPQLTPHLLFRV
jgi:predicted ATP-binding protein involved in virulence